MKLLKQRNALPQVAGFLLSLLVALTIAVPPCLVNTIPVDAQGGIMRWEVVPTPGSVPGGAFSSMPGRYDVLSPGGGEIIDYAYGRGGTVAAVVCMDPQDDGDVENALIVSRDYGLTWTDSNYYIMTTQGWNTQMIVHIAISPDNPAVWAFTAADGPWDKPKRVYYSDENGIHWVDTELPSLATGESIRSIDISPDYGDGIRDIGITTIDGDGNGRFFITSSKQYGSWVDQSQSGSVLPLASGADYFDIKFSPSYATDFSIALIYATETATYFNVGFRDTVLNTTLNYAFPAGVEVKNSSSATDASPGYNELNATCLQLPEDFLGQSSTLRRAYISLDSYGYKAIGSCEDGIFRIDDTHTYSLMDTTQTADKSIYSIAYYGTVTSGKLLAGERMGYPCTASVPTWFTDSPTVCPIPCWYPALKPTTGAANQGTCTSSTKDGVGACRVAWDEYGALAFAGTGALAEKAETDDQRWYADLYGPPLKNDEAAFAISRNNGETWNQVGLINTTIDWFNDVAPSIDCSTIYLASANRNTGEAGVCDEFDSVWRSTVNAKVFAPLVPGPTLGYYWERVLTHTTSGSCAVAQSDLPLLRLPMECNDVPDGQIVGWAAQSTNTQMWSPDYGDYWATIQERDTIQDFVFELGTIIYNLSPGGMVHKLTFSGTEWSTKEKSYDSRVGSAHTIAIIPKGKVLVGAAADGIDIASYSATGGEQWIEIPKSSTLIGNVHVVFDSDFASNKFVYLADDKRDENGNEITASTAGTVYREEVPAYIRLADVDMMDKANNAHATVNWPSGYPSPPHPVGQFGVVSAKTGDPQPALYTAHAMITTTTQDRTNSAVCRTIKPWQAMPKYGVGWDCLDIYAPASTENVEFTLEPSSLKYCGCCTLDSYTTLFAIDNEAGGVFNGRYEDEPGYTPALNQGMLWAYIDCLAKQPPVILSPPDGGFIGSDPVTGRNQQVDLSWEQLCLSIRYELEIYKDLAMTMKVNPAMNGMGRIKAVTGQIIIDLDDYNVLNPRVWLAPGSLPESGAPYFWRIRVTKSATGQIAISPWTPVRNFSIKPGFIVHTPVLGVELLSPDNSCEACPIQPTALSWTPYKEATKYEINLAKDPAFTQVIRRASTTSTAYQYTDQLEYSKSYYWRVRVTEINGKSNVGDWSSAFTFTTVNPPKPEPVKTLQQIQQEQFGPNYVWVIIVVVVLVVLVVLRLIVITRKSKKQF